VVHHSDRGSVYASADCGEALTKVGAVKSMSRNGDCWDNAVAESFFATIKKVAAKSDRQPLWRSPGGMDCSRRPPRSPRGLPRGRRFAEGQTCASRVSSYAFSKQMTLQRLMNHAAVAGLLTFARSSTADEPPNAPLPPFTTAFVHVNARGSVILESRARSEDGWVTACATPCDVSLPRDAEYRVNGPDVLPSDAFRLIGVPGQRVRLDVFTASHNRREAAVALLVAGPMGLIAGSVMIVGGFLGTIGDNSSSSESVAAAGLGVGVAGLAALVAGVILIAGNTTSVATSTGQLGNATTASLSRSDGDRPAPGPRAWMLPVYSFRF
jgi:hypothetical protein